MDIAALLETENRLYRVEQVIEPRGWPFVCEPDPDFIHGDPLARAPRSDNSVVERQREAAVFVDFVVRCLDYLTRSIDGSDSKSEHATRRLQGGS